MVGRTLRPSLTYDFFVPLLYTLFRRVFFAIATGNVLAETLVQASADVPLPFLYSSPAAHLAMRVLKDASFCP